MVTILVHVACIYIIYIIYIYIYHVVRQLILKNFFKIVLLHQSIALTWSVQGNVFAFLFFVLYSIYRPQRAILYVT